MKNGLAMTGQKRIWKTNTTTKTKAARVRGLFFAAAGRAAQLIAKRNFRRNIRKKQRGLAESGANRARMQEYFLILFDFLGNAINRGPSL